MSTAYPIKFKRNDVVTDVLYLKECSMDELRNKAKTQLTANEIHRNTIQIQDDQLVIGDLDDLEAAFDALCEDSSDEDLEITDAPPLVLTIILIPKEDVSPIEEDKTQEKDLNDKETKENHKSLKPTTIIKKGDLLSHFIKPTIIKNDEVEIKLSLSQPTQKTKSFFIHQCEHEDEDALAQYSVKKGKKEDYQELELDDIDDETFDIALYEKEHDKKSISNQLQITVPPDTDVNDAYVPPTIAIHSIQAIEPQDEKEDKVYIYFGFPSAIRGEDITFMVKYIGNEAANDAEYVSNPLIVSKSLIPVSFQVITCVTIDDEEYLSKPSDIITIDYHKEEELLTRKKSIHPTEVSGDFYTIVVDDADNELSQYHLQLLGMNHDDIKIRFDAPKAQKQTFYYVHIVGKEDEDRLTRMCIKKDKDHVVQNVDIDDASEFIDDHNTISISVYNQQHDTNYLVPPLKIQLPHESIDYITSYKPDTVSTESVKVMKYQENVYLYWSHPLSAFGSIKYKVAIRDDQYNETEDIIECLPYKVSCSSLPIKVQIVTIFSVESEDGEDKIYESALSQPILICKLFDVAIKPNLEIDKSLFDGLKKMLFFAQVTKVTNETFMVRLDALEKNETKRRKYDIKEIGKPDAEELEALIIPRKSVFGIAEVFFEDNHDDIYIFGAFNRDASQDPVSNSIELNSFPSIMKYPPTNNDHYKPQAIDVSTVRKILDEEQQKVYLYWNVAKLSFGDIQYKIIYNPCDDTKENDGDDLKDDIVELLPHSIALNLIPIKIQIITISEFNTATFYSDPSEIICVGSIPKTTTDAIEIQTNVMTNTTASVIAPPEIKWDPKPTYFMQITSVDNEEFSITLVPDKKDTKRKFLIKETAQNKIKKAIKINKNKESGSTDITIDDNHPEVYDLALFHEKEDIVVQNTNRTQFMVFKDKNQYPPNNAQYKPNAVDLSTFKKVKDENKVFVYWNTPLNAFGDISYQIVYDDDDHKGHNIELLPYTVPWSSDSASISFKVITISTVHETKYTSDPSETIVIGHNKEQKAAPRNERIDAIQKHKPPMIQSWDQYPNLLQILGVDSDTIKLRLTLKPSLIHNKVQKCYVKNIGDEELSQRVKIPGNKGIVTKDIDAEPDTHYKLAIFLNEKQISNVVEVQTPFENYFETFRSSDYVPLAPIKDSVQQYYDGNKSNILMLWQYPKLTFGEDIKYKIQRSDKAETQEIEELPYRISLPLTASITMKVNTVSVIDGKQYESKASESIYVDTLFGIPSDPGIITGAISLDPTIETSLSVQYKNDEREPITEISLDELKQTASLAEFRNLVIKRCNINVDEAHQNALLFKAKVNDEYKDILDDNFASFVSKDTINFEVKVFAYFLPRDKPKLIDVPLVQNDHLYAKYDVFVPFIMEYEISPESKPDQVQKRRTNYATNTVVVENIAFKYEEKIRIRVRCVYSEIFQHTSDYSIWSEFVDPTQSNQRMIIDDGFAGDQKEPQDNDDLRADAKMVPIEIRYTERKAKNKKKIDIDINNINYYEFIEVFYQTFQLGENQIAKQDLIVKADNIKNTRTRYTLLIPDTFKRYLQGNYNPQLVINVGKTPKQTQIGIITQNNNTIEFSTTTMHTDADHYQYKYELRDETTKRSVIGDAKRVNQMLKVDGVQADRRYSIRIKVFNGVADSPLSEWKPIDVENEDGDDMDLVNVNAPKDRVLIQNMDHRILWYITDKVLGKQSYISCTFWSDKQRHFPLVQFFTSKEPKLGIYYVAFPDIKYYKNTYFFIRMYTNIYRKGEYTKEEITHKTYTGTQIGSRKYTKYGFQFTKHSVVNVVDGVSNTWHIPYNKDNFYSEIALSFIGKLFSEINLTISPYVCICTIKELWSHLADHMNYKKWSKPIKIFTQMLEERVSAQDVSTISNWKEASEILSAVGAIMSINGTRSQAKLSPIDDDVLRNVYTRITDPKVFGSMKNILKHIEFMYEDWVPNFQTLCWMLQTKYPGIRQYNFLLWYNLLCCIKADVDGGKRTRIASGRNSITTHTLEKLIELDNRLKKFNQPHPFAKEKRKIIMKDRNATIQDCISVINDITDINSVYDFIQRYKNEINSMLGDNTDLYIKFASEILNRLLKSKQKNAEKTQKLQQVIISLLKKQMKNMRTQNEAQTFYEFYTKYRQFMIESGIDDMMLNCHIFVEYKEFIPIFAPLLQSDDDRCYKRLRKCTLLWLQVFKLSQTVQILRDNGLSELILSDIFQNQEDINIEEFIENDFRNKLEMITDTNKYDLSLRRLIVDTINKTFGQLNTDEISFVTKITSALLQSKNGVELCDVLLRKLVDTFNPFHENKDDRYKIGYIMSKKGTLFLQLLIALNKFPQQFHELMISNRLSSFEHWWKEKVKAIAQGVELFATVDTLAANDCFREIHHLYKATNLRGIQDKFVTEANKNLTKYERIKDRRKVIAVFFQHFVSQSKFYADDLKQLAKLESKLNDWRNTDLNTVFNIDFSLYDRNAQFLETLQRESRSKIKISVFKSIVEAQEAQWSAKPLKSFTTRDAVQWIRGLREKFAAKYVRISLDDMASAFYRDEIRGKLLVADDLDEKKIVEWIKSKDDDDDEHEADCYKAADVIKIEVNKRKQKDEELKKIKDKDKKYDLDKLKKVHQQLDKILQGIANELSLEKITVATTQKYLHSLAQEDEKQISNELQSIIHQADIQINFDETAKSIKSLFENIKKMENYQLLYDATQIFGQIMVDYKNRQNDKDQDNDYKDDNWELIQDQKYEDRKLALLSRDLSSKTIYQISTMQEKHRKYLTNLPVFAVNYLNILCGHRKIIIDLFEQFSDNQRFHNRMQLFAVDSPIDKQRSMSLTTVRNTIVNFVKENTKEDIEMTELHLRLMRTVQQIQEDDVTDISVVTAAWNVILHSVGDPAAHQYANNLATLKRISCFKFGEESEQNVFDRGDTTSYLKIIAGDIEDEKEQAQLQTYSQNQFSSLLDAILIFITGADGIPADIPQKTLASYTSRELIQLLKAKQLGSLGLKKPHKMHAKVRGENIDGRKIVEKIDIDTVTKLLFPEELLDSMEDEVIKKIASEVVRTFEFFMLQARIENEFLPKFDKLKELSAIRLNYYFEGGRDQLDQQRVITIDTPMPQIDQLQKEWNKRLNEWKRDIYELRQKYPVLTCFTVNDMRYLMDQIKHFMESDPNDQAMKQYLLLKLSAKLSFIDVSISIEEVAQQMATMCKQIPTNIAQLGDLLQRMFGDKLYNIHKMDIGKGIVLLSKKPHLFYCQDQGFILHRVIKLFLSRGQRPTANRILFCDKTTTIEQIECFLMRSALKDYADAALFCVIQPELLQLTVQDHFLNIYPKYINKARTIFTIMTAKREYNKIYQKLSAFQCFNLNPFTEKDSVSFFEKILCQNDKEFQDETNLKPLCKLILSQNECVGKSYWIKKMAAKDGYYLVHVPINTKIADLDFIVQQMYSNSIMPPNKIAFHINVSSDASYDVNIILFKLLVLRYLTKHSSGESFAALPNHAFFVELPSKLSSLKATTIKKVMKHFHFITKSHGIIQYEIQDSLKIYRVPLWTKNNVIPNELDLTNKEMFVYKCLDALDQGLLTNVAPDWEKNVVEPNWDYKSHPDIDQQRMMQLIEKYCQPGRTSLVFLKAFLQYMYQQLLLLYTSTFAKNQFSEEHVFQNVTKTTQYYRLIAQSLTTSAQHIACHMYHIDELTSDTVIIVDDKENVDDDDDDKDDEKEQEPIAEATGQEEFFLVDFWCKADPPLVLLNQHPVKATFYVTRDFFANAKTAILKKVCDHFKDIRPENKDDDESMIDAVLKYAKDDSKRDYTVWHFYQTEYEKSTQNKPQPNVEEEKKGDEALQKTDVDCDIDDAQTKQNVFGSSFSLIAYEFAKMASEDAKEWQFLNKALKERKMMQLDVYNFADDKNSRAKASRAKQIYREDDIKQKQKLELLLKICGGFATNDPEKQKKQIDTIYQANKDYALTFDNLLKIVAIFLRIKSSIPVLIMGETGCGKTKLLSYMSCVLGLIMETIDVHGGYTIDDLVNDLLNPIQSAKSKPYETILVFLDEINTSKEVGSFKEVVCDHSLKGTPLPDNLVIIAALNPYRTRKKSTQQIEEDKVDEANNPKNFIDDLDKEMSALVYRVYPIPPSMKTYVWNFGYLTQIDEQQYISVITKTTWNSENIERGVAGKGIEFETLMATFTDIICHSQVFLRRYLFDVSVCSLRDVRRCNDLFKWFFDQPKRARARMKRNGLQKNSIRHLQEAMMLALAQCYYYRLSENLRKLYIAMVQTAIKTYKMKINFLKIIESEQNYLVNKVKIPAGIALNRAFKENLFTMLVGITTKKPTVIVGKPGSSKTLAMMTLQDNLSSAQKNTNLTQLGFDDYWVIPFQCSKLTEAKAIADKWEYAEKYEKQIQKDAEKLMHHDNDPSDEYKPQKKVIFFLDEVGLAEQSPHRPLKVLHKLLENPTISFIGLSNWKLDAAKMNRCILHTVLPPNDKDLISTAREIMEEGAGGQYNQYIKHELAPKIPNIAKIYKSIIEDKTDHPFNFDFYGHRDFYSLISYLKFRLQSTGGRGLDFKDDMVLIEAVLRNFGGLNRQQTESFLFPRIAKYIKNGAELSNEQQDEIWQRFSPLQLIGKNIEQTKSKRRVNMNMNTSFELRNVMMITENTALFKILFDSNVLDLKGTDVIFGSRFVDDQHSNIYLYRTIDRVRSAMGRGDTVVLLKLEQLYDSLYDALNQRYLTIDKQKFCRICIGGESINCKIHPAFKIVVIVPTQEAHHTAENVDQHTPTAFLNRFEKSYLDIDLLQSVGFGFNRGVWDLQWRKLQTKINRKFSDHRVYLNKDLFAGYKKKNAVMTKITLLLSCTDAKKKNADINVEDVIDEAYQKLLKATSLQYLIQDRSKLRIRDGFVGYANLPDLIQREGVKNQRRDRSHRLLRVVTHDSYQMPNDFHGNGMKVLKSLKHYADDEEEKVVQEKDAINVVFEELNNFRREKDFFDYILSFLDNHKTPVSTLIIQCDPIPNNNMKESIFTHYLHAQYLIEKANAQSIKPNKKKGNEDTNTAKNIVFLLYMSRSNPYPLLFSKNWSHLYIDALSISDHKQFPEIQINDINIFDDNDKAKLLQRVNHHTGRIVRNNYTAALNRIDFPKELHHELQRFKELLDNENGKFYKILITRMSKILKDASSGAEKCILDAFRSQLENRGSFRSVVMQKLGKKIERELIHILSVIFSNGNANLYASKYDDEVEKGQKYEDAKEKLMNRLWLELLSEPKIIRFQSQSFGSNKEAQNTPIHTIIRAKFAFSANIHSYFMSFKQSVTANYKDQTIPMRESGLFGQRFLLSELSQSLNNSNMDFPIANLPEVCVENLLYDIVQLESNRLGIKKGSNYSKDLYNSICSFLWQMSKDLHDEYLGIKAKQKRQKEKVEKEQERKPKVGDENEDNEESGDEEQIDFNEVEIEMDQSESENDEDEDAENEKNDDDEEDGKDDEKGDKNQDDEKAKKEDNYEEQTGVQLHEIYASLWSNEKLLLQFVDVLSCIKPGSLKLVNRGWRNVLNPFIDCFGQTMKKILDELKKMLEDSTQKELKEQADKILSVSSAFNGIFVYLEKMQFNATKRLIVSWKSIQLSLICVSVCKAKMDGVFLEELYQRFASFDNIEHLKWLILTIRSKLKQIPEIINDILQYLYQLFVSDFAFIKTAPDDNQRAEFLGALIDICSEQKVDDDEPNAISLNLNTFSKRQTISKVLGLIRSAKDNEDHKDNDANDEQNAKIQLSMKIHDDIENQTMDESLLSLFLLSSEEQYLHYKHRTENEGKAIKNIKRNIVEQVVKQLSDSFDQNELDQLLAIAHSKLIIYYVVRYMAAILRGRAKFTKKGLEYRSKTAISIKYFKKLSELFQIPDNCTNANLISIKKGFQYFMVSSLWNSVLGPSRTMLLTKSDFFTQTLHIDIMTEMKQVDDDDEKVKANIPKDNPFLLLSEGADGQILLDLEEALSKNDAAHLILPQNHIKYVVFIAGLLFKNGFIKKGVSNASIQNVLGLIRNVCNKISEIQIQANNQEQINRTTALFRTLACNSMYESLAMSNKKSLEDIQVIRMMYHFIGVILSMPKSPFSTLFHSPAVFNNGYMVGMPEDESSQLFKVMKGLGVWLCPNDHMYFVAGCTWTNEASTCATCGAATGNAKGAGTHKPAPGNRRIGKIDANGNIVVEKKDPYTGRVYKEEELATYDAKRLTPKGYVDVGGSDDAVRNMNNITIRVMRMFVNIILLTHHCCDPQLSKIRELPALKNLTEDADVYIKLMGFIKRYINEIGEKLGIESNEDTLNIIHNIIHDVYLKYPQWIAVDANQNAIDITKIDERNKFEDFLVKQCIESSISNTNESIQKVRNKCSNQLMRYWSKRMAETLNMQSDDGKLFAKTFRPNLFLQFRFVTLPQFQTIMLGLSEDKKTKMKEQYPITYGILECINTDIGYSVFALKYLPNMITWMKNIRSRLNQRIDMEDIIVNEGDKYNSEWVLDQCQRNRWGDTDEWNKSLNGFVAGWNHVADRVTTDREKEGGIIGKPPKAQNEDEDGKDDEKAAAKEDNKEDIEEKKAAAEEEDPVAALIRPKNPFRKFVVLEDVCQALTILKIEPKGRNKVVVASDVPLAFAIDSESDDFTQSKMIRYLLQHLVEANNLLLRICYGLNDDDNGEKVGLSPRLSTTEVSQQRNVDVVNLDEEELTSIIQQCCKPRLKYGEDNKLDLDSFNLRLLERQLQQTYIIGRRFLKYDRVIFEFAGQHNIPLELSKIRMKNKDYFKKTEEVEQNLILLKFAIEQNCEYIDHNVNDEDVKRDDIDEKEEKERREKESKLRGYKGCMQAIEQTLIALSRMENYPDAVTNLIAEYMKNTLHLYPKDYTPFQQTKLKLQHLDVVWRYLEKLYILCQGNWMEIPKKTMTCYMQFVEGPQKQSIKQFIAGKDMNDLWPFLCGFRRFMKDMCKAELANPTQTPLYIYLENVEDIQPEMMDDFPDDIMLSQIGYTYSEAAKEYQQRLNDQQNN